MAHPSANAFTAQPIASPSLTEPLHIGNGGALLPLSTSCVPFFSPLAQALWWTHTPPEGFIDRCAEHSPWYRKRASYLKGALHLNEIRYEGQPDEWWVPWNPEHAEAFLQTVTHQSWDWARFRVLNDGHNDLETTAKQLQAAGIRVIRNVASFMHVLHPVPTLDDWLLTLSKTTRKGLKNKLKKAKHDHAAQLLVNTSADLHHLARELISHHQAYWQGETSYLRVANQQQLLCELLDALREQGDLVFKQLFFDHQPLLWSVETLRDSTLYAGVMAQTPNHAYTKLSPGSLLIPLTIEWAQHAGVQRLVFGDTVTNEWIIKATDCHYPIEEWVLIPQRVAWLKQPAMQWLLKQQAKFWANKIAPCVALMTNAPDASEASN